jgi:hypothetical protein
VLLALDFEVNGTKEFDRPVRDLILNLADYLALQSWTIFDRSCGAGILDSPIFGSANDAGRGCTSPLLNWQGAAINC